MEPRLILVNENDEPVGFGDKLSVHENGQLHRAFSIFILNDNNELLLQLRAVSKYHSGGLWANTCCSHSIEGEDQKITARRRLLEEMGFDCELVPLFSFVYKAGFENGLTEHEFDHVYLGKFNGIPDPDPDEVEDWKWMSLKVLEVELKEKPGKYVFWLREAFGRFNGLVT